MGREQPMSECRFEERAELLRAHMVSSPEESEGSRRFKERERGSEPISLVYILACVCIPTGD